MHSEKVLYCKRWYPLRLSGKLMCLVLAQLFACHRFESQRVTVQEWRVAAAAPHPAHRSEVDDLRVPLDDLEKVVVV